MEVDPASHRVRLWREGLRPVLVIGGRAPVLPPC